MFVGPSPEALALARDKAAARRLAAVEGIPVLAGTETATPEEALAFLDGLGPGATVMVKAVAGGGGRGMRMATGADELIAAIERCRSEAAAVFGRGDVYVEQYLPGARHVEVQILGDGLGVVADLRERRASRRRRHQKLVEIAPGPHLEPGRGSD